MHYPCRVSDPHPLSLISIVGQNYAKSAEKANFAANGRCGKSTLNILGYCIGVLTAQGT